MTALRSGFLWLPLAGVLLLPAVGIGQDALTYTDSQGVTAVFPDGPRSFADRAIQYAMGDPGPTNASYHESSSALGLPDNASLVLGCGGSVVLAFTDNALIDIEGPDLYVFEVGADTEPTAVEISSDGSNWIAIPAAAGATSSLDIASYVSAGASFGFVKLTDLKSSCHAGEYPGADIDAVGAIGSVPMEAAPTLQFVTEDGQGFAPTDELAYGVPFFVEASFAVAPEPDSQDVTLLWEGGTSMVTVFRTAESPLLYRSARIMPRQPGGETVSIEP